MTLIQCRGQPCQVASVSQPLGGCLQVPQLYHRKTNTCHRKAVLVLGLPTTSPTAHCPPILAQPASPVNCHGGPESSSFRLWKYKGNSGLIFFSPKDPILSSQNSPFFKTYLNSHVQKISLCSSPQFSSFLILDSIFDPSQLFLLQSQSGHVEVTCQWWPKDTPVTQF